MQWVAIYGFVQEIQDHCHICYGNKIHKSSWKIALQNIQRCLDIPCIRCWGHILKHVHPQRGVAHVGTGIIVPNNYGHHFPISVEVYPGIPSHRLDKSPGLSSQFYTCRARHSKIVSRCLPRANSCNPIALSIQIWVEELQNVRKCDVFTPSFFRPQH